MASASNTCVFYHKYQMAPAFWKVFLFLCLCNIIAFHLVQLTSASSSHCRERLVWIL